MTEELRGYDEWKTRSPWDEWQPGELEDVDLDGRTEMSKYRVRYTASGGKVWDIDQMPNGHLHNAAAKLQRLRNAGELPDDQAEVLSCMEEEIAVREKARAMDDPAFDSEAT